MRTFSSNRSTFHHKPSCVFHFVVTKHHENKQHHSLQIIVGQLPDSQSHHKSVIGTPAHFLRLSVLLDIRLVVLSHHLGQGLHLLCDLGQGALHVVETVALLVHLVLHAPGATELVVRPG